MAETVNPTELAQAINAGKSLVQIAQQMGCTSLTVARVLYGHYAHASLPAGLEGQALRHYMTLRHAAIRLCQKAGVGPPREEDTELPQLRKEVRATLSKASLAADMEAGRSIAEMARKRGVTEKTIRGYLHRHGLFDAKPQITRQTPTAIVCEGLEEQLSNTAAAGTHKQDATQEPVAPQSPSEAPGAIRPPSEGGDPPEGFTDKPAPQAGTGQGIRESNPLKQARADDPCGQTSLLTPEDHAQLQKLAEHARTLREETALSPVFYVRTDSSAIAITLTAIDLTVGDVRRYLRIAEGNLELAGDGLELQFTIRGPRR